MEAAVKLREEEAIEEEDKEGRRGGRGEGEGGRERERERGTILLLNGAITC